MYKTRQIKLSCSDFMSILIADLVHIVSIWMKLFLTWFGLIFFHLEWLNVNFI
jgi:hypothetical protein